MPLAQATSGVPFGEVCASALTTERMACAGTTSRMASARAASPSARVDLDLVVELHARQEVAFALLRKAARRCRRRAPTASRRGRRARRSAPAPFPRRRRRARDALKGLRGHAMLSSLPRLRGRVGRGPVCRKFPLPPAFANASAGDLPRSGRGEERLRLARSFWLICTPPCVGARLARRRSRRAASARAAPRRAYRSARAPSRSAPAQAIMAPLSVHNSSGGATSTVPASMATRCSTSRIAWLAATPPAATSALGAPKRARKMRKPARSRS